MVNPIVCLLIILCLFSLTTSNLSEQSEDDLFDLYVKGFLSVSKDGPKFSELIPCKSELLNQTINIQSLIDSFEQPISYDNFVVAIYKFAPISDSFGYILTHCLPAYKQFDNFIDEIRNILDTDYQTIINFIIDSFKKNYLEFAKEAVEIYDLRSNYIYDKNVNGFYTLAGKLTGYFYNRLRLDNSQKGFLKN